MKKRYKYPKVATLSRKLWKLYEEDRLLNQTHDESYPNEIYRMPETLRNRIEKVRKELLEVLTSSKERNA